MSEDNYGFVTVPTFGHPNVMPILKMKRPNVLSAVAGGALGAAVWVYLDLSTWIGGSVSLLGFTIGVLYVVSAPPHLDAWQWTKTLYAYARRPRRYARTKEAAEHVNDKAFTTGEETRELTHIKRFYPYEHVIERKDGSLVGYVEIHPPHRDFATPQDWYDAALDIAEWYNSGVDFQFQLHVTTEAYPIENQLETLEDRLSDSDVLGNQILRKLIEQSLETKRQEFEDAPTEITHFYALVSVDESEVSQPSETDQTAIERLQKVSGIGIIFEALGYYTSGQVERTEQETKLEMARTLRNRIDTVMDIEKSSEDLDVTRLTVGQIAALQRGFWRPAETRASFATTQPRTLPTATVDEPEGVV